MGIIEFDFVKAEKQAEQLEVLARQLEMLTRSDFGETMQLLSTSWKGTAADSYMKKAAAEQTKMQQTANGLRRTAESLRSAARTVKIAEDRAKELAQQKNAGT